MKKIIIGTIILGLIIVLVLSFIFVSKPDKLTDNERQKAIDQVAGGKANLNGPQVKTGNTSYQGKRVNFSYPAAAEIYEYVDPNSKKSDKNSESFSFDLRNPRLILNFTSNATKESKLEDISAVKFRDNSSSGYAKSQEKVGGLEGVSYKKDRSGEYMAEKTTFVLNDGYLFTFSITGSSIEDIEKLHKQIIGSVELK